MSDNDNSEERPKLLSGLASLIVMIILAWYFFGGGLDKQVDTEMKNIYIQVANDSIDQYKIAKRNGSNMDACVQAEMVTAAILQMKDEENYKKWKKIEDADWSIGNLNTIISRQPKVLSSYSYQVFSQIAAQFDQL